ncbi:Uncharacterized protein conserved in bacteria [Corynebacterium kutscheri]|uniref:Uncharacterized protein conserved in bacteria n=1 Tax=Corynebacterium kutscheri TaxID=35755 RepID=A0A0F6R132_9CORY|nr:hypothetical protein UL82_09700 [Corynebacterium kutscheri]VEH06033.1 Uncharacterized protein conserved in bacteria [Corynebacterium kutscheri]VEH10419.1 Uncharacterized protein conserved in bacteria [Corynebacterium kutscheri]VEH81940.1 Uncharacterized protein conserved in bacteria [Corynebacterium kutscheri]
MWTICLIIPLLSVGLGSLNFYWNQDQLEQGWYSLNAQVGLFYGLIFFNIGAAIIVSSIWRDDIKKSNWQAMQSCYRKPHLIFIVKALIGALLIAIMHLIFTLLAIGAGLAMRVDGIDIAQVMRDFLLLILVSALPLACFQGLLSYLTRSFAWPIGISMLLCVSSFAVVSSQSMMALRYVIAQALSTFTIAIPSVAFSIESNSTWTLLSCLVAGVFQSTLFVGLTLVLFARRLNTT